ncbi:hypothetical protein [Streptomyces sp. NBC_00370]|uniref:hypothetical protein n=1 Tax=Streptomyces sp. NBC_00370 TaxID=2975728 RepID=UPI0030E5C611
MCAVAIYLSCEWFVNVVEWLGQRLNVGKMAVGTILAAFGTALPESVVTLVAVTTGGTEEAKNIGVGAAMGGPLALATVAYGAHRPAEQRVRPGALRRPQPLLRPLLRMTVRASAVRVAPLAVAGDPAEYVGRRVDLLGRHIREALL